MADADPPRRVRVAGVVGDVRHYGLDAEVTPDIYVPIALAPDVTVQRLASNMYWGMRTAVDPASLRDAWCSWRRRRCGGSNQWRR